MRVISTVRRNPGRSNLEQTNTKISPYGRNDNTLINHEITRTRLQFCLAIPKNLEFFLDTRGFAGQVTQVIQFGAAHITAAFYGQ